MRQAERRTPHATDEVRDSTDGHATHGYGHKNTAAEVSLQNVTEFNVTEFDVRARRVLTCKACGDREHGNEETHGQGGGGNQLRKNALAPLVQPMPLVRTRKTGAADGGPGVAMMANQHALNLPPDAGDRSARVGRSR